MDDSTKKIIAGAVTTLGVYSLLFGIPFQGTIGAYVYNRQVLKQHKIRFEHEEAMARIKKENEEN